MMPENQPASAAESIMVGARGWEHPQRAGGFYPEELPADWRFTYYSNHLRSVLVPSETWKGTGIAEVREWVEDSDPDFRFVLELPAAFSRPAPGEVVHGRTVDGAKDAMERALKDFLETVEPIAPRMAGFLLRIPSQAPRERPWLERILGALGEKRLLCVDLPPPWRTEDVLASLARCGAGVCWHPEREPAPLPGGRLLVALSREGAPRAQRRILEQLIQWQGESGQAALFFDTGQAAVKQAKQARLIAELLDA